MNNASIRKSRSIKFGENVPIEYNCHENIALLKRIEGVSNNRGITVAQTAIAWLINHKMNVCAILSPAQYHHIKSDIDEVDIQLTDDEFEYIVGEI